MAIIIDENRCPQNHHCPLVARCPVEAITQVGYGLPVVDAQLCIACGKCVQKCPMGAVQQRD